MIFVEPHSCWRARMVERGLQDEEEARRRNMGQLHPIQNELMQIVRTHDGPIRDTSLAHAFAKIAGYHSREERDSWIKTAWQYMTALVRKGLLEWSSKRKHLEIAPPEKHQAWQAKIEQALSSLPKPRV